MSRKEPNPPPPLASKPVPPPSPPVVGRIAFCDPPKEPPSVSAPLPFSAQGSRPLHRAVKVWQERENEICWKCSCGTVHKHCLLPCDLVCLHQESGL